MRATYFIQTKYVRDWNDEIILNDETAPLPRRLVELGMEVGSHTVAYSKVMSAFPLGSGAERYPAYRPFVQGSDVASSGTIIGELRVSKFLIETVGRSPSVVSFRPGHLPIHRACRKRWKPPVTAIARRSRRIPRSAIYPSG